MAIEIFPPSAGGIPTGSTAARPSSPSIGDVFYNGTLGQLDIYTGNGWEPSSAVPGLPVMVATDVGTDIAYGSAQALISVTPPTNGGIPSNYLTSSSTGGYTLTTSSTSANITVGNNAAYTFSTQGVNDFGTGIASVASTVTLTTLPEAPTIGTATTSGVTSDVTITWTNGSNGGKNLSAITITPYLDGTTAGTSQNASTTSSTTHTFTGLTQGSSYTFKVKAVNANGTGLESSATNSITVPQFATVGFLVIGGGGGGGNNNNSASGGGGGAGGFRTSEGTSGRGSAAETAASIALGNNFTVTVGAGAAMSTIGSSSVLAGITSLGGGRGHDDSNSGGIGGSGGGAGSANSGPGGGTAGQGFGGGSGFEPAVSGKGAGGGGGAGSAGFNFSGANGTVGGAGGNGQSSSITGSAVTRAGGGAGGGGGGGANGGSGGGGGTDVAGTALTGGGGGRGASGGSGIVIMKYISNLTATVGAGLTSTENSGGGFKVRTFNAGTGNVSLS